MMDNAIHWINNYPVDSLVCFAIAYLLDRDLCRLDSIIQPLNNNQRLIAKGACSDLKSKQMQITFNALMKNTLSKHQFHFYFSSNSWKHKLFLSTVYFFTMFTIQYIAQSLIYLIDLLGVSLSSNYTFSFYSYPQKSNTLQNKNYLHVFIYHSSLVFVQDLWTSSSWQQRT